MSNVITYNAFDDSSTRLTVSNDSIANGSAGLSVKAHGFAMGIDATTGEVVDFAPQRMNTATMRDSGKGYEIRSSTGSPVLGRAPKDDDIVNLGGLETTYANAIKTGLITPDGAIAPEKPATEKAPEITPTIERMDDATEALMTELAGSTMPSSQVAALSDFTEAGEISDASINRLASEAGIHPTEMRGKVERIMSGFQAQADRALRAYVTEPDAVYEWARQNDPAGLKRATQELTMQGSSKGFTSLGSRYFETADKHSPELVEEMPWADGVTVVRSNGRLVIHHPGGSDPWSTLVKTGRVAALMSNTPAVARPSSDWVELPTGRWFNTSTAEVAERPR